MRNDDKVLKERKEIEKQEKLLYQQALYNDIYEYQNPIFKPKKNPIYNDSIRVHKKRLNKYNNYEGNVKEIDDNNNLDFIDTSNNLKSYEQEQDNNVLDNRNEKKKLENENNVSIINRVFSPPDDENLNLDYISKKRKKNIKMKKDNCFRNFFIEILKVIKEKKYSFYHKRMEQDVIFRSNLI